MLAFRNILVPTDFSVSSSQVVEVAVDLARTFGAGLTLLHVYEIPRTCMWARGSTSSRPSSRQRRLNSTPHSRPFGKSCPLREPSFVAEFLDPGARRGTRVGSGSHRHGNARADRREPRSPRQRRRAGRPYLARPGAHGSCAEAHGSADREPRIARRDLNPRFNGVPHDPDFSENLGPGRFRSVVEVRRRLRSLTRRALPGDGSSPPHVGIARSAPTGLDGRVGGTSKRRSRSTRVSNPRGACASSCRTWSSRSVRAYRAR